LISGVPSDFLGAGLLIGFIALTPSIVAEQKFFRFSILTFLAIATIAFAKGPYMYAVTVVLVTLALHSTGRTLYAIPPVVSSFLLYLFFRQGNAATSIRPGLYSEESLGEHASTGGLPTIILAIAFVIAPVALGLGSYILIESQSRSPSEIRILARSLALVVVLAIASRLFLYADSRAHSYLFQPGVIASGLLALVLYESKSTRQSSKPKMLVVIAVLVASLWTYLVPELVPSLDSGSFVARFLRMVRDASIVNLILLLTIIVGLLLRFSRRSPDRVRLKPNASVVIPLVPLVLLVSTSIPFSLLRFEQRFDETSSGEEDVWREAVIGSADARDVSARLRDLNLSDELAAYTLCSDHIAHDCIPPLVFGAYSEARFLSLHNNPPPWGFESEAAQRDMEISMNLLSALPSDGIQALRRRGVSLLIIDLKRAQPDWSPNRLQNLAKLLYSNQSFALLRLNYYPDE
jgi:hypothetical protein